LIQDCICQKGKIEKFGMFIGKIFQTQSWLTQPEQQKTDLT